MPWPVTIRVTDPGGKPRYEVHRSLDAEGRYAEAFPVGANAPAGEYVVRAASPVGNVASVAKAGYRPSAKPPAASGDRVRVFDETAIRTFLATKPTIVIAIGSDKHKATADRLAQALNAKGINASVVPEQAIIERVRYPRVWDPYFKVYRNQGAATKPEGPVDLEVKLEIRDDGRIVATTQDGKDLGYQWRHRRKTLATVVGKGYIDYHAADGEEGFEPGCRLYINEKGQRVVLKGERTEVKATADDIKAQLRGMSGGAKNFIVNGVMRVTDPWIQGRRTFNHKLAVERFPTLADDEFWETGDPYRQFTAKAIKNT